MMADQIFPEPTVGAFIFNQAGKLLLLKSHKWPGMYVVPGGHVELGERIEDSVIREAKEETGLDVYAIEFINFQEFIYDPSFWKPKHPRRGRHRLRQKLGRLSREIHILPHSFNFSRELEPQYR